ncbi:MULTISPECIES: DNA topoisomerase (ATP-hydrolyzing) subunit A [unclassified Colwellia]|jgi:DNA gyrase subunit A|uniref:DNA topoisomerase (ATP-hydrolyzing) subunit A n=1 Tax=unclassified Colwellia TaxID=196834 RepID=UPI0015F4882C|nr:MULTISPECIES: DNA topoisomerase (ATP-hydrolyzing) subunit A [unclassified Colwellia]MBA6363623.1 DNA topoisomerase (ATP-hydrolyzing) subunit A [Colwellia sp. BRX8-8]MBA6337088.1 DNA topoisomerase (ATP-hydrolyzing) subunit A [Colwellia sp. BRX8-7]MBA6349186.1 DNA topoisomerase (ATP-hydrolyzing) subunit A [Colwellia sp. BRX8-9]MBA6353097.1 DNA topoisomerase (ATP-hydrolyzing) subunit A [Colwellia sp. BRX9-1]MBA6356167.1 DNA topoisomerase (ATP-hydrolyzing) subunit A [Colwellia sp. BRX8-3]
MTDLSNNVVPVNIEDELKNSYLDYAMSVIVGRALPDVRDGLKPVHRRVLFAMNVLGNDFNKPYKKSARVVGDVIGKYHPHGDTAVYDTIVRMAQPFSLRYMLVDGQGNFGSVDGDSAAAMRYTEIRMSKIAHSILADLDKETVDFVPNYDGTEYIPVVMPTRIPNLLVNGTSGIAVGMATNIPPHNLTEVINGCLALIENSDLTFEEILEHIPGPDFPTAGIISGRAGIEEAYRTGRGKIKIRARADIEVHETTGKETIVVHELPYQVNKARLIEKMAELVKEKRLEGISALRDESDKDGMRMVIEIKRGEVGEVVLNNLYKLTQMQVSFGLNMVALTNGQPKLFNIKEMLEEFILHRREVVTRRTIFELRKARERAHLLEGLSIALANIDPIIELIKNSPTPSEAKEKLLARGWDLGNVADMLSAAGDDAARPEWVEEGFGIQDGQYFLTMQQAQAILDLRLHKLTGLEHEKILSEYKALLDIIAELLHILGSPERLMEIIREELETIRNDFGDERRTEITNASHDLSMEDLITEEDVVVTLSHEGYVKYQVLSDYQAQRRGGKGKAATKMKEEDFIERLLIANTHDTILCFSDRGKLYWLKVFQLPLASRTARGRPIVNILPLDAGERITAILPVREYAEDKFIIMATASGTVKKTALTAYKNQRANGIIALNLRDDDTLIGVAITDGYNDIMLFSDAGKVVRFNEKLRDSETGEIKLDAETGEERWALKPIGRTGTGVRGIKLEGDQKVVSLIVPVNDGPILTITENGFGKRTALTEYPAKSRATKGVVSIKVSDRNGPVVGAVQVEDLDEIMLITDNGTLVRTRVNEVSVIGRNTQGVRIIRTVEGEHVVALQRIDEIEEEDVLEGAEETSEQLIDSTTDSTSTEVLPEADSDEEQLIESDNE